MLKTNWNRFATDRSHGQHVRKKPGGIPTPSPVTVLMCLAVMAALLAQESN